MVALRRARPPRFPCRPVDVGAQVERYSDAIEEGRRPVEDCANLGEAPSLFRGEPLMFQPGTKHHYSIYGWMLVSVLVERVAQEPFRAFMTAADLDS